MSGVRKRFVNADPPKRDFSDRITMSGARIIIVAQEDGTWPPFAEIVGSKSPIRKPTDPNAWIVQMEKAGLFQPLMFELTKDEKWCSHCGDKHHRSLFTKDNNRHDGYDVWCKVCRAADQKRRYWLSKDSEEMWQQWEVRHIKRAA